LAEARRTKQLLSLSTGHQ